MIGLVLARRYAKALIDLAEEAGQIPGVREELAWMDAVFGSSQELVNLFMDPTVPFAQKKKVLTELFEKGEIGDLTRRFVTLLLDKNRLDGISEIAEAYGIYADEREHRLRARVHSAVPLEDEEVDRFRKILSEMSGKEVVLDVQVDEDLVGGVVTRLGGEVYDGSLKNQLQQMKENLSKGR